jgi:2-oxoacid:acceptor oxidoreductase delta subunit (pyruvate/2-ketoisovalerate family)
MKYTFAATIAEPGSSVRNKTGGWRTMRPVRDKTKCTKCGICWQFCPDMAINEEFDVNLDYCKGCGICAQECPFKAITMVKEEK